MLRARALHLLILLLLLSGCGQKGPLYREEQPLHREASPSEPATEAPAQGRASGDEAPPQDESGAPWED